MKGGKSTTVVQTSFVYGNTFTGGHFFRVRTSDDYYDFLLHGRVPAREELRERLASLQRTAADWTSHAAILEAALAHHDATTAPPPTGCSHEFQMCLANIDVADHAHQTPQAPPRSDLASSVGQPRAQGTPCAVLGALAPRECAVPATAPHVPVR